MNKLFGVLLVLLACVTPSYASYLIDCGLGKNDCHGLVGKRLWVSIPSWNPNVVEVSPSQYDYEHTLKLRRGSFLVEDVVPNKTLGYDFVVALPNGKTGYVWNSAFIFLLDYDPVKAARRRTADCVRRGQPKIGMTEAQVVASCWGRPTRVIKKTTAEKIEESFLYVHGRAIRLVNGRATEIIESQ